MRLQRTVLAGAILAAASAALRASEFDVVLSEVHYNPLSGLPQDEYLEIYNRGPTAVDVSGWRFREGITLTLAPGTVLGPKEFLVLSPDPAHARSLYGITNVHDRAFTGRLDNDGEILTLEDTTGRMISRLHYGSESIWPSRPDGLGPALEIVDPQLPTDLDRSWASSPAIGGTPGRPSSRWATPVGSRRILVASQGSWRYSKGTKDPSAPLPAWTTRTFADGGWPQAAGAFGYGAAGAFTTELTDMRGLYTTLHLRARFTLSSAEIDAVEAGEKSMTLTLRYDDAYVAYVNGAEVGRENAGTPGTYLPAQSLADGSRTAQGLVEIDPFAGSLVAGENVLAIQGLNNLPESSDFLLDAELVLAERPAQAGGGSPLDLNEVKPTEGGSPGFIELFNEGAGAFPLAGHAIIDSAGRRFLFGPAASVPGRGRLVLTDAQLGFAIPSTAATYVVVEVDPGTGEDLFVEGISTAPCPAGASFGRYPDGDDDLYVLTGPTSGAPNTPPSLPDVVVNEIHYHPPYIAPAGACTQNCSDAHQWIEIHNRGASPVGLAGWSLSKGIDFTFTGGSIPGGGYLVVASSRATFLTAHPGFDPAKVIGDWTRDLAHDSDTINLNDALGNRVDHVVYGDGGPRNDEEPEDGIDDGTFAGSTWPLNTDGTGRSIELIHPRLDNRLGGSWAGGPNGGTPGAANAALAAAPFAAVDFVEHSPAVPRPSEPVTVTCRVTATQVISAVEALWHREGGAGSGTAILRDDGLSGDGRAGNGVYGGVIPAQPEGTIVGFQVRVRLADGKVTTAPRRPAIPPYSGFLGPYFLYQVLSAPTPLNPSDDYYLVLSVADENELTSRPVTSNVLLPCTLIELEPDGGEKVRHLAGIRFRGGATRREVPTPYRVSFPSERPFRDIKRLNLNSFRPEDEIIVSDLFRRSDLPYPQEWTVNLTFQGTLHPGYVRKERLDGDFTRRFFGGASDSGNFYRALDPSGFPNQGDLTYFGPDEDPADYIPYYQKRTNEEETDYSDIIELTRTFDPVETPDGVFADRLEALIDPDEWARFFALQGLISNTDGSIQTATGEDYFLYRVPATSNRRDAGKWLLVPWDIEESFSDSEERLFRPQLPPVRRFLTHSRFAPLYYGHLTDLRQGAFSRLEMRKSFPRAEFLAGTSYTDALEVFLTERNAFIEGSVPLELTAGALSMGGGLAIALGETWRYWKGTQAPSGTAFAWTRRGYPEGAWLPGATGIGYGDGDDATSLTDMLNGYTTIYARKTFPIANPAQVQAMELTIDFDDGFVAYLNGTEVARRNVDGNIGAVVPFDEVANADHEAGIPEVIDLGAFRGSLLAGDNVLAFEVLNRTVDSSDLSFRPELSIAGLGTGGVGCGDVIYAFGASLDLAGHSHAFLTRSVTVGGSLADYDPLTCAWSAAVPLVPGENAVLIEAHDGEGGFGSTVESKTLAIIRMDRSPVEVSGTLPPGTTRWTSVEGPYMLRSNLTVPPGSRLEVQPGTVVLGQANASIIVRGEIQALGTAQDPIRFHAATCAAPWGGISIEGTGIGVASVTHSVRHADLTGASSPPGRTGALSVTGSKLIAEGAGLGRLSSAGLDAADSAVEVRESAFEGVGPGIISLRSTVTVFDSSFRRLTGGADAIRLDTDGAARSRIERCRIEDGPDDGISVTRAAVDIRDNFIAGFEAIGIAVTGDGTLGRSTLTGNIVHGCGTGLSLMNGAHVTEGDHNTIAGNQLGLHLFARSGAPDGGHATFHSMIVWCNVAEVLLDPLSNATFTFSDLGDGPRPGTGNISDDPGFLDPLMPDYALISSSPCIGTGQGGTDMGAVPFGGVPETFIRTDADGNGTTNITDAILLLDFLFRSGTAPSCLDAGDGNDDGTLDLSDGIYILFFLFRGDLTPAAPYPSAGTDPTPDALGC